MKKVLSSILFMLCLGLSSRAQVFIFNDNIFQERMGEIKAMIVDSLTNEPVPFASVYVIPSRDTTITNFTLSDAKGEAKLDEVPFGSYVFHVEMMGYKPFVKERYFRDSHVDMGTIRLQEDLQFLQAATITDVGNPIIIKKDTVEFNASSFRVGANAMLKDLLLRMPGMEITEDGKVKFNGKEIDKITVGGRTFFFDDQSTAINNLPASVVDKIRVIDRESEETRASGLQDGDKERVLDVGLKKEYEKGWFGNLGVKGGTTLGDKADENPLRDDRGFLWGGNALVSAYTEKDQVTLIASGQNIDDSGMVFAGTDDDGIISVLAQGLPIYAQLGFNANTARIKGVESTLSVNYKDTDTDSGDQADRVTYLDDGNLASSTRNRGKQYARSLNANLELKKEEGKVWFHVRPSFRYGRTDNTLNGTSETSREGAFVNSSENTTHSLSISKDAGMETDISFRDIGGKKGRSLRFNLDGNYGVSSGNSEESNHLKTSAGTDSRVMSYLSDGHSYGADSHLRFTEPLGDQWTLSAMGGLNWSGSDKVRDAFDGAGRNDYYSSLSRNNYIEQQYDMTAQYKFGERNWITLGGRVYGILNETFSKSFGLENTVGEDEWNWHVAPTLRLQFNKENDDVSLYVTGYGIQPSASRMQPVLNIADPSRLSLGNMYLKPYSQTYLSVDWTRSNPEKFSTLMVLLFSRINASPVSQARWFDTDGIQYSIPVNAQKPTVNGTFMVDYTTPIDSKKNWFLSVSSYASVSSSLSYQARGTLPGLDKDTFDYAAFMDDFWGDASGNRFYSGQSGFGESRTHTINPYAYVSLRYNPGRYSFIVQASTEGHVARYSLDPGINLNTLDTRLGVQGSYTTKHEFEFNTDMTYSFFNGYSEGYGQPEWEWNAEINKSIGAFILSVKVHDILNQTRNLTHTVTANYEEDSYRLVMGRYLIFGVKWNFGKMNAAHSQRAQRFARDMVFQ
ncbi:MAG: carboxypeptidase regulatory-like domain-containing protein [Bacteroidales bacterium]|nr:carboxypeptidase regulatory-like domain-containing protein [Bacteroidales bacterium]